MANQKTPENKGLAQIGEMVTKVEAREIVKAPGVINEKFKNNKTMKQAFTEVNKSIKKGKDGEQIKDPVLRGYLALSQITPINW